MIGILVLLEMTKIILGSCTEVFQSFLNLVYHEIDRLTARLVCSPSTVARLPVSLVASAIASERSHQTVRPSASAAVPRTPAAITTSFRILDRSARIDIRPHQFANVDLWQRLTPHSSQFGIDRNAIE